MQANLNAITSRRWRPMSRAERARWRSACRGAWQADWRERRRDWRVWLVLAIGVLLALCAALLCALDLQATLAARSSAQQAEQRRWSQQGAKYPHAAAHYGVYVFKPLSALAALDPGIEQYVGASVWLEAHKQNDMVYRRADDDPGLTRQLRLSPAFVLQVLAPMAMIFLGFGLFAAERERGTLAALRINAAPLGALAVARGAVLLCLALAMALPACLAVVLLEWGMQVRPPFTDGAARGVLFALGYLVYLCGWAALVAGVSAWSSTVRASLAALIAIWATTALVLPRAALELAQLAAPLPSMQQFRQQLDADIGMPDDPQAAQHDKQQLMRQYGVSTSADLPLNWAGISLQRGEEHGNRIFDLHYGRLFDAMEQQSRAAAWAGWLSPAVALAGLSSAAAGSDHGHHIDFVRGAERQRRLIQQVLNQAIAATPERNGKRVDADRRLWDRVPPFHFVFAPLDLQRLLWQALLPLLAFLGGAVLLCAAGLRRLNQGDLR